MIELHPTNGQQIAAGPFSKTRRVNTVFCNSCPAQPSFRCPAKRPLHHVNFFCDAPEANSVRLVGDFNGWDLAATPMERMPDGRWMAGLELYHGHHQYLFIVDGEPMLDPNANGIARNERNERVSLISVS